MSTMPSENEIELLVDGPIEPEHPQQMRAVLLGGVLTQEEVGGIPAHPRQREDDQREDEEERHALDDAPQDVSLHGSVALVSGPGTLFRARHPLRHVAELVASGNRLEKSDGLGIHG